MTVAISADVVTSLLRPLTDSEESYAPSLLERAESHLIAAVPRLVEWANEEEAYRETVASIEADMVARLLRNPEGFVTEKGDLYSYRLDLAVASGRLEPTPNELFRLRRGAPVGSLFPTLDAYARARYWRDPNAAHPFLTGG